MRFWLRYTNSLLIYSIIHKLHIIKSGKNNSAADLMLSAIQNPLGYSGPFSNVAYIKSAFVAFSLVVAFLSYKLFYVLMHYYTSGVD